MVRLEPGLRRIADELVGAAAARGGCEVVGDVALPTALRSLALALGCPPEAAERWRRWGHDVYATSRAPPRPGGASTTSSPRWWTARSPNRATTSSAISRGGRSTAARCGARS